MIFIGWRRLEYLEAWSVSCLKTFPISVCIRVVGIRYSLGVFDAIFERGRPGILSCRGKIHHQRTDPSYPVLQSLLTQDTRVENNCLLEVLVILDNNGLLHQFLLVRE